MDKYSLDIDRYGSTRQTVASVIKALRTNLDYEETLSPPDLSHMAGWRLLQLADSRLSTVAWVLQAREELKREFKIKLDAPAIFGVINFLDMNYFLKADNVDSNPLAPSKAFIAVKVASLLVAMKSACALELSAGRDMIDSAIAWPPRASSQDPRPLVSPSVSPEEIHETEAALMFQPAGLQCPSPGNIVNLVCYYLILWLAHRHAACCGDDAVDLVKLSNSAVEESWHILLSAYLHVKVALLPVWKCAMTASAMGVNLACQCAGWRPCAAAQPRDGVRDLLVETRIRFRDQARVQTLFSRGCAVCRNNIANEPIRDRLVSLTGWTCLDCGKLVEH